MKAKTKVYMQATQVHTHITQVHTQLTQTRNSTQIELQCSLTRMTDVLSVEEG